MALSNNQVTRVNFVIFLRQTPVDAKTTTSDPTRTQVITAKVNASDPPTADYCQALCS